MDKICFGEIAWPWDRFQVCLDTGCMQVSSGREVCELPVVPEILEETRIRQVHRISPLPSFSGLTPGKMHGAGASHAFPCMLFFI
jgi:hypothetical protein